jgi:hypothetical protein
VTQSLEPNGAELLVLAAGALHHAHDTARVRTLAANVRDWRRLVDAADEHGVLPLLDRCLAATPDVLPHAAGRMLFEYARSVSIRSRLQLSELVDVMGDLSAAGVPAITFKGPSLAALAYGDTLSRQFVDLDLLVRPVDLARAERVLDVRGYRRQSPPRMSPVPEAFFRRTDSEYEMVDREGWTSVDLHWTLLPDRFPFQLDEAWLWDTACAQTLGGAVVTTLALEPLLLFLTAHGAKERWRRLIWIADIDRIVRRSPGPDWTVVVDRARRYRCWRALRIGLEIARQIFGTPLPAALGEPPDARVAAAAEQARRHLFSPPPARSLLYESLLVEPFVFRACDSARDRFRYASRAIVTPGPDEFARVPLPDMLFPVYFALRPLMVALGIAQGGVRRLRLRFAGSS